MPPSIALAGGLILDNLRRVLYRGTTKVNRSSHFDWSIIFLEGSFGSFEKIPVSRHSVVVTTCTVFVFVFVLVNVVWLEGKNLFMTPEVRS